VFDGVEVWGWRGGVDEFIKASAVGQPTSIMLL
jgi:hypothetical protein